MTYLNQSVNNLDSFIKHAFSYIMLFVLVFKYSDLVGFILHQSILEIQGVPKMTGHWREAMAEFGYDPTKEKYPTK